MTWIYTYIAIAMIITVVLGMIFLIGAVCLIIGIVKKKKAAGSAGKKLIVSGSIMMAVSTAISLMFVVFMFGRLFDPTPDGNRSLPERWQHSMTREKEAVKQVAGRCLSWIFVLPFVGKSTVRRKNRPFTGIILQNMVG